MLNNSMFSSAIDSWQTPDWLFRRLDEEFSFVLDPCCTVESARCAKFYTVETDGLAQVWSGAVYMNPPYGRGIIQWVKKAYEESRKLGCVVVCLLPVRSDTRWWHLYCMKASEIRLLDKRLEFKGSTNKAPFPSAVVIFDGSYDGEIKLSAFQC